MARERGLNGLLELIRRMAVPAETQELADAELMGRYSKKHDQSAFTALLRRYGPMVLGVCRRVLGTSHDAEDAFQATFLALAREIDKSGGPKTIGPWLYTVAYNVAQYEKKRASKAREREHRLVPLMNERDPFAEAANGDIRAVIDEELLHLPEKYRRSLILCDLFGAPNNIAAQEMGLHPRSMTKRLNRARHLLRKRLIARGIATQSRDGDQSGRL
jgi:RNA polymerase sigma factor (sigma-70 family)